MNLLLFALTVSLTAAVVVGQVAPNYQGCLTPEQLKQKYCDTSLSYDDRVDSLLDSLTLDELVTLVSPNPNYGTCPITTASIDRVGMPNYMWLVETNTGVASACIAPEVCATTFIGPTGLGATFNRTLWQAKGDVIATEMRAFGNAAWYRAIGDQPFGYYQIGITGYGPNINMIRDPRFGRNSELPSEDPYLTGTYAINYLNGMQTKDSKGHPKMIPYVKHFTAYSTETNRGHDNYEISMFDLWDTYLPQYEMAFVKGNAPGAMCSYNAVNGFPSCANDYVLNKVVREKWNRPDAVITTDCGAVPNLRGPPVNAPSDAHAAAFSIMNGTDIEAGSTLWGSAMSDAIDQGLATKKAVRTAARRAMMQLFKAGRFDPLEEVEWYYYGIDKINSTEHQRINYEAALQSFVLLKNDNENLPISKGVKVAVVGPHAVSRYDLLSDYYGDYVCYDKDQTPDNKSWDCIQTIGEAITRANSGSTVVEKGVDIESTDTSGIAAAVEAAQSADVVVLALGIGHDQEHEGIDRTNTTLPGLQESFAQQILKLGKPTTMVLVNGGALAIDTLMDGPDSIVEAFYPSVEGARALADTLFGDENRWGKLPFTMYPADYINIQPLTNYDMSKSPGRTYRYFEGKPLWTFGEGLSYSTFSHACMDATYTDDEATYNVACEVTNTGDRNGDEVLMVYHSVGNDIRSKVNHPVPKRQLVEFSRVSLESGKSQLVTFTLDDSALELTNENGDKVVYPGEHTFTFSRGNGQDLTITVNVHTMNVSSAVQ